MFSDKERELVSIGAAVGANCEPCVNFHLRAARIGGASDAEISQAVSSALAVRRQATEGMARFARQHAEGPISNASYPENSRISELVSISAAAAANSISDLETHLAAARKLGATKGQVLSAIKLATAAQGTADSKTQEATVRALGVAWKESVDCGGATDCSHALQDCSAESERAAREGRTGPRDCNSDCACNREPTSKHS